MGVQSTHNPKTRMARQIVLPWKKSMAMAFNSLRLRFFRSLVTGFSLVLAIAFLSYTLTATSIARELYRVYGQTALPALIQDGYVFNEALGTIQTGAKDVWLIVLSLLVCTMGIINAQLMSVTERFREIGIMKCLGALDRIVLRLFLIEAMILGVAGAGVGSLAGMTISWLAAIIHYGNLDASKVAMLPLIGQMVLAWGVGIGLSLIGVLYPAALAARLQPVSVMKGEY